MTNEPCQLDTDNYCARHGTRHVGHLRALALGTDARSQRYRAAWDKRGVSLPRAAVNYAAALAGHLADGMREATLGQIAERRAACESCEWRQGERCTHKRCGCSLSDGALGNKLRWASQACPVGKWNRIPLEVV